MSKIIAGTFKGRFPFFSIRWSELTSRGQPHREHRLIGSERLPCVNPHFLFPSHFDVLPIMLLGLPENSSSRSDILLVFLPIKGNRRQLGTRCAILVAFASQTRNIFLGLCRKWHVLLRVVSRSGHYRSRKPSESELYNDLPISLHIPRPSAKFETATSQSGDW